MFVEKRIYKTADGRFVPEGDPDAAFLAYPVGEEISDHEAKRLGLLEDPKQSSAKAKAKPEDKAAAKSDDK